MAPGSPLNVRVSSPPPVITARRGGGVIYESSFSALWLAGYAHTALVGSRLAPHFYHHPALPPGP